MTVKVTGGKAYVNGRYYNSDGDLSFILASSETLNMLDCSRFRKKYIKAFVKDGATLPNLTRDNSIYEISLAKITMPGRGNVVASAMIVDERSDSNLCGFFPFRGTRSTKSAGRDGSLPRGQYAARRVVSA